MRLRRRWAVMESIPGLDVRHCRHWTRQGAHWCATARTSGLVHHRWRPKLATDRCYVRWIP